MRKIFAPKRDEVIGGRRKLHNEELRDLDSPPIIITIMKSKRMRWARHVAPMDENRTAYRLFVGQPERRTQRRQCADNIKMDFVATG
jgi:hypothetical protein